MHYSRNPHFFSRNKKSLIINEGILNQLSFLPVIKFHLLTKTYIPRSKMESETQYFNLLVRKKIKNPHIFSYLNIGGS